MVFKTLHWYIFRELLRIFVLTASALTTLLAFCGTFKPLTKRGLEISQLLSIMTNFMPAMLAYSIPIAALFAAVLVYWRLSTDNELTACRASGISFQTIVMPALILGVVVASTDLVFVNYVVPVFLQRAERAVFSDLGSLLVSQVGRQEKFEFGHMVVYADAAVQKDSGDPNSSLVVLDGMAATNLKDGKPTAIVLARQALLTITESQTGANEAQISVQLVDAAAFDPKTFRKYTGSINTLTSGGEPIPVPSGLKNKPKFLNLRSLFRFQSRPSEFQPVAEVLDRIDATMHYQEVSRRLLEQWQSTAAGGETPLRFAVSTINPGVTDELRIYAPGAGLNAEEQLNYLGTAAGPVRVEQYHGGRLQTSYTCGEADMVLSPAEFTGGGMNVGLQLKNNVMRRDHIRNIGPNPAEKTVDLPGLILPAALAANGPAVTDKSELVQKAMDSKAPTLNALGMEAMTRVQGLLQTIDSELHSRGSFSVSCLTLVLLGAALGILLRGRNPLAVFVVGFVPAIVLVLLITAGRQMAEGLPKNVPIGIGLIWAGNGLLLLMVGAVYAKLLRH